MGEPWLSICVGAGVLVSIVLCFVFNCIRDDLFYEGGDWFTGFLWGGSVSTLLALFIPGVRSFMESQITDIIKLFTFKYPQSGSVWFWIVLVVCAAITVAIWIYWERYDDNVITKAFWMLLYGLVYFTGTLLLIGIAVRLIVLAIGIGAFLFVLFAFDGADLTKAAKPEEKKEPEEKEVKVWREYGAFGKEYYKVSRDQTHYYDPDLGEWVRIKD